MTVTAMEIAELHVGAEEANKIKIKRLANLLKIVAEIGQMRYDNLDAGVIAMGIDDLVEAGAKVARDLASNIDRSRTTEGTP